MNHVPVIVPTSNEDLELADISREKMIEKVKDPDIQRSLIKQVRAMKAIFENMEAEVDQNAIDKKYNETERKNLLIINENLIDNCIAQEVFYTVTDSVLTASRFHELNVAYDVEKSRAVKLKAENSKLLAKIQNDDHDSMVKHFFKLEIDHLNLQLKYQHLKRNIGNSKSKTSKDGPEFDAFFELNKWIDQLQAYRNTIRNLKDQISHLKVKNSDVVGTFDHKSLESQNIQLKETVTALQERIENYKAKNEKVKRHYQELFDSIKVIQIVLWYLDSGYSKHMTMDRSWLKNFMKKFIGTVRFRNDHFGAIMGYEDYVIGDSVISRVYYMEGLIHNLFTVDQFCDSNLEVSFRKHTCFVSKNKSLLLHHRLNYLNFGTINDLAHKDLVRGLPKLKFEKDHLCSACQLEKSKKYTYKPKTINTIMEVLHTLHMDLCEPMRVQNINGKKYILFIVDNYSQFTWVKFLRSQDETPEFVIKLLKQLQFGLNKTVRNIRTDNGIDMC
nr:hypothetical protein [Tanacetum cinerariifolium]